jgi:hypothetical protein
MGDATLQGTTDTQSVRLPVDSAARNCTGSKKCCDLPHHESPFGLGTDGNRNLMTPSEEMQVVTGRIGLT